MSGYAEKESEPIKELKDLIARESFVCAAVSLYAGIAPVHAEVIHSDFSDCVTLLIHVGAYHTITLTAMAPDKLRDLTKQILEAL
jgi:hypothetical protein